MTRTMIWRMRKRSFSSDIFPMEDIWKWVCVWCSMKHLRAAKCTHSCIAPHTHPPTTPSVCIAALHQPPLSFTEHDLPHSTIPHHVILCHITPSSLQPANQPCTNPTRTKLYNMDRIVDPAVCGVSLGAVQYH